MRCGEHPVDCLAQHVLTVLSDPRCVRKGQWRAHCPAHNDEIASLSIAAGRKGQRVVWDCHAGCSPEAVRTAMIKAGVPAGCLGTYARRSASDTLDRDALVAILESDGSHAAVRLKIGAFVFNHGTVPPGGRDLDDLARRSGVSRAQAHRIAEELSHHETNRPSHHETSRLTMRQNGTADTPTDHGVVDGSPNGRVVPASAAPPQSSPSTVWGAA